MADALIDLEGLLAPLPAGVGRDPREDTSALSAFRRLRDARDEARNEERARDSMDAQEAGQVADLPLADGWRRVLALGAEILLSQAKDFDIAVWMTEALVRQYGLPGLEAGTRLLVGLVERHWEKAFPLPDEDGLEDRARSLGGLSGIASDGTLLQPLRRTVLFRRPGGELLRLYQYDRSEETALHPKAEVRERRYAAGLPDLEQLALEAQTVRESLWRVGAEAQAALEAWNALSDALAARFVSVEVPTTRVGRLLERMLEVTGRLAGGQPEAAPVSDPGPDIVAAPPPAKGAPPAPVTMADTQILGRENALQTLERIADYFEASEPHSPLAYTLRDAVRRARMTLPDLLREILPDDSTRLQMLTTLGIRPSPED